MVSIPRFAPFFSTLETVTNVPPTSNPQGHSRPGAFPDDHDGLLPGCDGYHAGVRHHAGKVVRKHQKLDPEHRGERIGRRGKDAAGEQVRAERETTGEFSEM